MERTVFILSKEADSFRLENNKPENSKLGRSLSHLYFSSQQVDFNTTFYSLPAVLVSVHHYYSRQANHLIPQENNIITAWVEVKNSPLLSCVSLVIIMYIYVDLKTSPSASQ